MVKASSPKSETRMTNQFRMTNDDIRRTKGGRRLPPDIRHSGFVIDSSFWFHHSDFQEVSASVV